MKTASKWSFSLSPICNLHAELAAQRGWGGTTTSWCRSHYNFASILRLIYSCWALSVFRPPFIWDTSFIPGQAGIRPTLRRTDNSLAGHIKTTLYHPLGSTAVDTFHPNSRERELKKWASSQFSLTKRTFLSTLLVVAIVTFSAKKGNCKLTAF